MSASSLTLHPEGVHAGFFAGLRLPDTAAKAPWKHRPAKPKGEPGGNVVIRKEKPDRWVATTDVLTRFGKTPGCPGCEGVHIKLQADASHGSSPAPLVPVAAGHDRRHHSSTCRKRIESAMKMDELDDALDSFRRVLIHRYHSMVKAWRELDREQHGRISWFEFCRACRELGYDGKARTLWQALDENGDGFVSFYEFDQDLATLLGGLAAVIWAQCGSVDAAWERHFNTKWFGRCSEEMFAQACREIGFTGDVLVAYDALNVDKATTGLHRKDFGFLELWFAKQKVPDPIRALHDSAEQEKIARHGDPLALHSEKANFLKAHSGPKLTPKDQFKKLLLKTYGTYVRAWRLGLDRDHNGRLDREELTKACQDIGYPGSRQELWDMLDDNGSGEVSLGEIDKATAEMLESFIARILHLHGSWDRAWGRIFDKRSDDRVDRKMFIEGNIVLGWGGNADRMFELLDTHKLRYLTWDSVSWLTGGEAVGSAEPSPLWEDLGDFRVTGQFKKATKSAMRSLDNQSRENRLRRDKFLHRDKNELAKSAVVYDQVFGGGATTGTSRHLPPELRHGMDALTNKNGWCPKSMQEMDPQQLDSFSESASSGYHRPQPKFRRNFIGALVPEPSSMPTSPASRSKSTGELVRKPPAPLYNHGRYPLAWLTKPPPPILPSQAKPKTVSPKAPMHADVGAGLEEEEQVARLSRASVSEPSLASWQAQAAQGPPRRKGVNGGSVG